MLWLSSRGNRNDSNDMFWCVGGAVLGVAVLVLLGAFFSKLTKIYFQRA